LPDAAANALRQDENGNRASKVAVEDHHGREAAGSSTDRASSASCASIA
jgi:hypothetical protein